MRTAALAGVRGVAGTGATTDASWDRRAVVIVVVVVPVDVGVLHAVLPRAAAPITARRFARFMHPS